MAPSNKIDRTITTDTLALADFVHPKRGERILEIGTGSGYITTSLACRFEVEVVGIDISRHLIKKARENALERKSMMLGTVCFAVKGAIDMFSEEYRGFFDCVVCNPPFYPPNAGRKSPNPERAVARQEIAFSLETLFEVAAHVLRYKGRLYGIHPAERLADIMIYGTNHSVAVKEIVPVYTRCNSAAKRILVMSQKGAKPAPKILFPLKIY